MAGIHIYLSESEFTQLLNLQNKKRQSENARKVTNEHRLYCKCLLQTNLLKAIRDYVNHFLTDFRFIL